MPLENKINVAYWVDLGRTDYEETLKVQSKLVGLREQGKIPDIFLCTEFNPVISFGNSEKYNKFSSNLLKQIKKLRGKIDTQTIVSYLKDRGIKFNKSARGGGAIYHGPGQIIVYPIVEYELITKKRKAVENYNALLDDIMVDILKGYGIKAKSIEVTKKLRDLEENLLRINRRDVWVIKNKKPYKIAGKGIKVSKKIAYFGFCLFSEKQGLKGFKNICVCGYPHSELGVTCIEDELGVKVSKNRLKQKTRKTIKEKFHYTDIKKLKITELKKWQ